MARYNCADCIHKDVCALWEIQNGISDAECVYYQPTLTPPNEPLTCEGCIHEEKEHQNCNYCMRASYLGDYYYRCPPEGEA